MKKAKRVFSAAVAMALLFTVATLSSCSRQAGATASVPATKGTLTIGMDDTYPPMEYKDSTTGKDVGFEVDMASEIGKRLDMNIQIQSSAWDGIFPALNAKKFDCILSSVSITEARLQNYAFTKPYIANAQMIVVKKGDSSIKSQSDLRNIKVGCQVNTTASDSADALIKKGVKLNLTTYDQIIQCFQAMKANRVQAIIVDEVVGEYYIHLSPNEYQAAALKLTNEPLGVCFRKSDTALRDKVQGAIDAMVKDGTMKSLSEKWFGKDLTSNIDTKLKLLS